MDCQAGHIQTTAWQAQNSTDEDTFNSRCYSMTMTGGEFPTTGDPSQVIVYSK